MGPTYLIASKILWNPDLPKNLAQRVNARFQTIQSKTELNPVDIEKIDPAIIFFPHWSDIVPEYIFKNYECIIFHMTDVPFGRGGSPLQNLIANGIYETKMSAIQCVAELDAGHVYLKKPLPLHGNAQAIYINAFKLIEDMIVEIIQRRPVPVPQTGKPVTFERRKPQDGDLSGLKELFKIYDYIRMLDADGYPRAFLETDGFRFEFERASFNGKSIKADVKIQAKK